MLLDCSFSSDDEPEQENDYGHQQNSENKSKFSNKNSIRVHAKSRKTVSKKLKKTPTLQTNNHWEKEERCISEISQTESPKEVNELK